MTILKVVFALLAVVVAGLAGIWWWSLPATPEPFYDPPGNAANVPPGTLLRHVPFERGVPAGARAWRILYATTRSQGAPAIASAIVLLRDTPPGGSRSIVAWTHGTTGAAPGCGPSLLAEPFANVPAFAALIEQGWAYVATDYIGMSTPGTQSYLVGESEGRAALDAVRAARQLPGLGLTGDTVVWGHSQGGHSALWTGHLAPHYAPDVRVIGVAAAAPASLPGELMRAAQDSVVGKIMTSFVLRAYTETYDDVSFDSYVNPGARLLVRDMARRCLAGREALVSVVEASMLPTTILSSDATTGALGKRLDENVPRGAIGIPVLIAQGLTDDLVLPSLQDAFVQEQCQRKQVIEYRRYAGLDHLQLVGSESRFSGDLVDWTRRRFAHEAAVSQCVTYDR